MEESLEEYNKLNQRYFRLVLKTPPSFPFIAFKTSYKNMICDQSIDWLLHKPQNFGFLHSSVN